jgi:ferredoxin--NADP+ reductase
MCASYDPEGRLAAIGTERVLAVRHWTETQFSFTTTRDRGLRFENGQFVMLGLAAGARPLLRAYSIASANHEENLEFLSIKVPGGPLTSRLQHWSAASPLGHSYCRP